MTDALCDLVRDTWSPLMTDHGFVVAEENAQKVVLDSPDVRVVVSHDPRGELDVDVFPHGTATWAGWSYTGMIGRASVSRLLELVLAQMKAEPAVLRGDTDFYRELAERQSASNHEWTAYYSGQGPRPGKQRLP